MISTSLLIDDFLFSLKCDKVGYHTYGKVWSLLLGTGTRVPYLPSRYLPTILNLKENQKNCLAECDPWSSPQRGGAGANEIMSAVIVRIEDLASKEAVVIPVAQGCHSW